MLRLMLILGICLTLTACTNDANKDLEKTTTTTTQQTPKNDNNKDPQQGANQNDTQNDNETEDPNSTDSNNSDDTPTSNSNNQGNVPTGNGDVPTSNSNNSDSSSGEEGNDSFDYLTIQETSQPAITKVDGILLVNKSFYLEKDYVPNNLTKPNIKFSFSTDDQDRFKLTYEAATAIELLFNEAKSNGIELAGVSLYRSYARQKSIYNYNIQNKGEEHTSMYSAKPGYSEHQTGLAIDVSAASSGYSLVDTFGETEEGKWVKENCARFGFIIRFLKGKEDITGYAYEPWHLRYVGVDAATYIMDNDITLEEYYSLKDK